MAKNQKPRSEQADNTPFAGIRLSAELSPELAPYLARAGNPSGAVREFLNWGVGALQAGRTEIGNRFTLPEWRALADCFNGTLLEPALWPYLASEFAEADAGFELSRKWNVDGPDMTERLDALSPAARWALCDALLRLKVDVTPETLRKAGVRVREEAA